MVVIWQEQAKNDLKDYLDHTRIITEGKARKYILSLVDYANSLAEFPYLGKSFYHYNNIEIRQLLYEMHRIFYYIKNNEVIIISVIHTSRSIENTMKYLKNIFQ